jgi:hypothetical protein
MTIHFLYGRRESLHGKSEAFKRSVREYVESIGFSQTTDSSVEGSFADMIFYNPGISPSKKFMIETKAEIVSLKSRKLARELIEYFRLSQNYSPEDGLKFLLFIQGVKKPREWESMFSETNNLEAVRKWCKWYNSKCLDKDEAELDEKTIKQVSEFLSASEVIVGNNVDLQQAAEDKRSISGFSIPKMAKNLLDIVDRRRAPIRSKSKIVMNILPIVVPNEYYTCKSTAKTKNEIYAGLEGKTIPPFLFARDRQILTFSELDQNNPLCDYVAGSATPFKTAEFQIKNPTFCSQLVNIHLRRIFWNKGIYRDPDANIYYFPMIDEASDQREVLDHKGVKRWVVKKIIHKRDTQYHKKGEINFFFHRGVELRTPTYWGISFVEMIPRRYYTLNGADRIDGKIRDRIDRKFRNPKYDRSKTRLSLMRFWRFILFESAFVIPPEDWFNKFKFGNFLTETVNWSPQVIGRNQKSLWDFTGEILDDKSPAS